MDDLRTEKEMQEINENNLLNQIRMIKSTGLVINVEIEKTMRKIENEGRDEVNDGTIQCRYL